jgi:hypothetical protein
MIVTIDDVTAAAGEVYYPEGVAIWLDAPNRLLRNTTPRQLVDEGRGDQVLALIEALADGAFLTACSPADRRRPRPVR